MAKRKRLSESERSAYFWREVVYQAVRDLKLTHEANKAERDAARTWILDDAPGLGSFAWACRAAELDPEKVREEVREVK